MRCCWGKSCFTRSRRTPRLRGIQYAATFPYHIDISEYWIARRSLSSGAPSRDPLAGDDRWGHVSNNQFRHCEEPTGRADASGVAFLPQFRQFR